MAPSKFLWLDIRTGLGELFIQEYHEPYESNFWLHRDQEPQIIMFIGDKTKIISLNRLFSFSADDNHDKIHLREVPGQYGTQSPLLIADCGLHKAASLEKVLAGPVPANIHQSSIVWHHKVSFSHEPYTIANIVYAQLISPFSTLICLFADDLGGIYQVARLLTTWIGIGLLPRDLPPEAYPRLLILKAWDESSDGYFDEKLATHAFLQILNVELKGQELVKDGVRATDLLQRLSSGLNVLALPIVGLRENQTTPSSWVTLRGRIQQDSAEVQERRRAVRTSFHAKHLKALFYSACDHFSADLITPFSFIQASRSCNPVPQGFSKHLTRFLQISKMEEFSIPVIASALVMDSCPPGMHYFEPSAVFHSLYIKILQEVQRSLYPKDHDRFSEIYEQVKDVYCKQASDVFRNKIPSAAAHRTVLAGFSKVWKNYYSYATCFACVARCAERRLSCQHALCEPCIRKHGSTATDDAQQFILNVCPLCLLQNTIKFRIRPDTAGIRGLSICGAVEEDDIAQFLHKLQIELGLIASPLQDHFDIVVGDNSGAKYILGIFCKGWPLQRCLEEFQKPSTGSPYLLRKTSKTQEMKRRFNSSELKALFGSETLFSCYSADGTKVAIIGKRKKDDTICILSTYNGPGPRPSHYGYSLVRPENIKDEAQIWELADGSENLIKNYYFGNVKGAANLISWEQDFLWSRAQKAPDILVSLGSDSGSTLKPSHSFLGKDQLRSYPWALSRSNAEARSISSIGEALKAALFYPELVSPPVVSSAQLVCHLRIRCRLAPSLAFQNLIVQLLTSQARFYYGAQDSIPCVDPQLYEKEKNEPVPFSRQITIIALSYDDFIDVKLGGIFKNKRSISNCPYRLKTLVQDQGLECSFGNKDHQPVDDQYWVKTVNSRNQE